MPIPDAIIPQQAEVKTLFGPDEALTMAICNAALAAEVARNWELHGWLWQVIEENYVDKPAQ